MEEEPANEHQAQVVELIGKVHRGRGGSSGEPLQQLTARWSSVLLGGTSRSWETAQGAFPLSLPDNSAALNGSRKSSWLSGQQEEDGEWACEQRDRRERGMERQGDVAEVMGKPSSETVIWVICQAAFSRPDLMFSQLRPRPPSQPFTSCLLIV